MSEIGTGKDVGGVDAESWESTELGAIGSLEVFSSDALAIGA